VLIGLKQTMPIMKSWICLIVASLIVTICGREATGTYKLLNNKSVTVMENTTYPVKLINVSINKPATDVYRFASDPKNFPEWVAFVQSIKKEGDSWKAESSLGSIRIKFTPQNEYGIIDHHVTLPNGEKVHNPMRVLDNNKGSEFIFTLFRMPGRSDAEFNEDANAVAKDLQKLKTIMESR
jgi:uncharacterized membrane protein